MQVQQKQLEHGILNNMKTNHLSRVLLIAAVSLMVNGCYADGPSAVSASPNSSDLETAETVTICTRNVPFDIEKVNDVLEEKDYPYRLKHVQDISAEELLDPSYTCETGYMKDMEMMEEYDIFVYDFVPSYFESLYREGLLNDLDDSLRSLLPNDMYSRFGGNSYIFPSNFSYTPYMDLNPDVY